MEDTKSENQTFGQPWLVGMLQNRLNPNECKLTLRTLLSVKELEVLIERAKASVVPEDGKEGDYIPVQFTSEVVIKGPNSFLPIDVSFEVHDESIVPVEKTLYGLARSKIVEKSSGLITPP